MAKRKGIMSPEVPPPNVAWAKPALAGITFFFTGTLQHSKKKEMVALIEREGGKIASSLNANVNYLVVGKTRGQKTATEKKATSLNKKQDAAIQVIDEVGLHRVFAPNPERVVEMLKAGPQGILFWEERWSYHWLQIELEITGAKLRNLNLSQLHMPHCTLTECDLSGSTFDGSQFGAVYACKFDRASMQNVDIGLAKNSRFREVKFSGLELEKAENCDLQKAAGSYLRGSFFQCDLRKAKLESAWLYDAENCNFAGAELKASNTGLQKFQDNYANNIFSKADLRETDFSHYDWVNCNWNHANLEGADLSDANFHACTFVGAKLKANLSKANFTKVDFTRADLRDADLMDAVIQGGILKDANFRGAVVAGIRVEDANASSARGLKIVELVARGSIGQNVRKLEEIANESENLFTSIRVQIDESWYEVSVNGSERWCHGSVTGIDREDDELSWVGSYQLFGAAMLEVAGRVCRGTPDMTSVKVKRSKCPLKPKECKELATLAWAEVFDSPWS